MSKRESKQRIKRRSKAYRRAMIYVNVFFVCFIVFFLIFGSVKTFTHKKDYRREGIDYYNQGEYELAIDSFDRALACKQWFSTETNVDIQQYKAACYMKLYDYENAKAVYNDIEKKYARQFYDEENIDFLILLNDNLMKFSEGDYTTGEVFSEAVDKGYTELSLYAGMCYEAQKDYELMKSFYDIYSSNFGFNSFLYYKYATYYILQEDYDTALSYVNDGINSSDQEYIQGILYSQIICYEKMQDYDTAFSLAGDYVELYPEDTEGADMYAFLDTRINPNEEPVNDIFSDSEE